MTNNQSGKVYLVGAGLGSPAYLTLRAQELLALADLVIYDALVDAELLRLVPAHCQCWYVGKRGGQPSMAQSEIDRLLVEQGRSGQQVVRLKSGDPFIFGRCTSEIQALQAAGCPFEVVPGISSALAAPLLAGIPLTDPMLSRCFAVLTAHDPTTLPWTALAQIETLVVLMGGQNLAEIVAQLIRSGRTPATPIAIIRWAGRPDQQTWVGTLATIVTQTAGCSLAPCVMVIGAVVSLQTALTRLDCHPGTVEYEQSSNLPVIVTAAIAPLSEKTILVTRSAGQSGQFMDLLSQAGAQVIEMPALVIGPPSDWAALDDAIATLQQFDWLILTSTNGVEYFFQRLAALGKDARALAGVKIAVVGEKTALSLKQHGLKADFIPPNFIADSLATHLAAHLGMQQSLQGQHILFPRVESGGREVLVAELSAQGATVVEVPAYESGCPTTISPAAQAALQQGRVDVVTFASSKTVRYFRQLLEQAEPNWQTWLEGVCVASIGPQTSESCRKLLGRVDVEAKVYTLEGLAQAIMEHLQ
ncbi:uroporphyrinogen-III C-methyltransferase [Leptolyngbya sp. 'hensonii']|uniref:uroporphyrinogen-III C-methyltransferase n=1 Tax=Leptolyngbya sp. 'hensonii' TaxID=1922337 RepID=UPI0009501706|nr:uroporphyrinogen-III C-methyltransferase [Leptolyngbya sp. 'hensonii']OLP18758.1 uroporphyrinogen-III C-methyltransferase [Leptolyngbya sp. 'hensonii']